MTAVGDEPIEDRTGGAHDDEAAEQRDLGPELVVCGAINKVRPRRRERKHHTGERPGGIVLGSVIMKNRKISISGEVTITRQKSNPHTGSSAHAAVMQCPKAASRPSAHRQREPERGGHGQEAQAGGDEQAADEDDDVGRDHPDIEGSPPEVERLDPAAARGRESDDQPDVRRVEHDGNRGSGSRTS